MVGVELGRVDRRLQVQAEVDVAEKRVQRPLLLLVTAWRTPRQVRLTVSKRQARAQRGSRPRPRPERRGKALLEPEHLRTRPERPAERWNDR